MNHIKEMLLKAFICKEKYYKCEGLCDRCIYKDIHKTARGCNPTSLKDTVDKFIKENI